MPFEYGNHFPTDVIVICIVLKHMVPVVGMDCQIVCPCGKSGRYCIANAACIVISWEENTVVRSYS